MIKKVPWIVAAIFALWILSSFRTPSFDSQYNVVEFAKLPVLLNGRVQPMDSVARNSLLAIQGKQTVKLEDGSRMEAIEWFMEALMHPEAADSLPVFRIHHPEVLRLLDIPNTTKQGMNYVSFNALVPKFEVLDKEADRIREIESERRNPYEQAAAKLHFSLGLYRRIKNSVAPESTHDFAAALDRYEEALAPGILAAQARESGMEYDEEALNQLMFYVNQFDMVRQLAYPLIIPPENPKESPNDWTNIGTSLLDTARQRSEVRPEIRDFAGMATAFHQEDPARFNEALASYKETIALRIPSEIKKAKWEFKFNYFEPFTKSIVVYLLGFILACLSWLNLSEPARKTAYYLVILGFITHTVGLAFRMALEGRPPVTNLYSSAVFVGWGAVILGLFLEKIYRDGIGTVTATSVGFITLLVAHYLSLDGDTMEMLRAVLDTNAWLATHVVVINLGYSATYIAGFLAVIYIIRGLFTKSLKKETAKSLSRMVYGIICFATLFSFIGTVLGGIWADQSWGRFWGWDPKENGALLIVLWNAIILHARWGGMIRDRGLMVMSVFGNIVTTWSYFGVNTLGIGLHSYGFMDGSFKWMTLFNLSQLIIMGCAAVPTKFWLSFRNQAETPGSKASRKLKSSSAAAGA